MMGRSGPRDHLVSDVESPVLLDVRDLEVQFISEHGWVTVAKDVSFGIHANEAVGLVGESGSGKTVTALSILGVLPRPSGRIRQGQIIYRGTDLVPASARELDKLRGSEISMIFQDAFSSLNPAFTIGHQIAEVVRVHQGMSRKAAWSQAIGALDMVRIPAAAKRAEDYPHQLSGGMAQRALIAMAVACKPSLLIADEPTTALDVTVQADILDLLRDLRNDLDMAVLLVTHDLGVIADFCERVVVMYAGRIVESASADELFDRPLHPYTEGLLTSIPQSDIDGEELHYIRGVVPPPWAMPSGCSFHPRCSYTVDGACTTGEINLEPFDGRLSRCVRSGELRLRGTK